MVVVVDETCWVMSSSAIRRLYVDSNGDDICRGITHLSSEPLVMKLCCVEASNSQNLTHGAHCAQVGFVAIQTKVRTNMIKYTEFN